MYSCQRIKCCLFTFIKGVHIPRPPLIGWMIRYAINSIYCSIISSNGKSWATTQESWCSVLFYSSMLCCLLAVWCSDSHDFPPPSPRLVLWGMGWFSSSQPRTLQPSWQACLSPVCVCLCFCVSGGRVRAHVVEILCIKLNHRTWVTQQ